MVIESIVKSFSQLSEPKVLRILGRSLVATALTLLTVCLVAWSALAATAVVENAWLDSIIDVLGGAAAFMLAILLFPAVAALVSSFFLDDVAEAVEARHYPDLPPTREQPLGEAVLIGIRFAAIVAALNILALPLYFIPGVNVFVFLGLNGYLLSREYFELVALRRFDRSAARRMWRKSRGRFLVAGLLIAALLSVPFVNLIAPVVATAFMVHVFEGARRALANDGARREDRAQSVVTSRDPWP